MITFLFVVLAVSLGIILAALDEPAANDATRAAPEANEGPGAVDCSRPRDDVRPVFAPAPLTVAVSSA